MGIEKATNFQCVGCGIEKHIRPSNLDRYTYCSIECKVKCNKIVVQCPGCQTTFNIQKQELRGKNKYCSWDCYKKEISTLRKMWWNSHSEERVRYSGKFKAHDNPMYKNGNYVRQQIVCQTCNKIFYNESSYKFCSQNCFGIYQAKHQKLYVNSKYGFRKDLNCWFRSAWEANVARYLNLLNKQWLYEDRYINLPNGTKYLPDFYLSREDKFVEVKGYLSEKAREKIELASKISNLEVINSKDYYIIEKKFSNRIKYWEY